MEIQSDTSVVTLSMEPHEADMLMFALTKCDSPAANATLAAMAKHFGYKPVLIAGDDPLLAYEPYEDVKTVFLYANKPIGYLSEDLPGWTAKVQEILDIAAVTPAVFQKLEEQKTIWAIKALREAASFYMSLYFAKTAVDRLVAGANAGAYTYSEAMAGKIKFDIKVA